jgi:signal transduction histidine kinase
MNEKLTVYGENLCCEGGANRVLTIYIVVQSRGADGKVLAHAANAAMVGTPLSEISDQTGLKFAEVMSVEATTAGSWFEYDWSNPETGVVGKKKSWAVLFNDLIFIAGIYVP